MTDKLTPEQREALENLRGWNPLRKDDPFIEAIFAAGIDYATRAAQSAQSAAPNAELILHLLSLAKQLTTARKEHDAQVVHKAALALGYRPDDDWYRRKLATLGDDDPTVIGSAQSAAVDKIVTKK